MMKTTFNKTVAVLAVLAAVSAATVYGQNQNGNQNENGNERFCTLITGIYSRTEQRIVALQTKLDERRVDQQERLALRRTERSENSAERRQAWDENRQEHFAKLEERAQTEEQKAAVLAFRQTIEAAVSTRRTAIDLAQEAFRQGLDNLIVSRKQEIDALALTYREAVRLALQEGQTACTDGETPRIVRERIRTRLQAAREEYRNAVQGLETTGSQVTALVETRNAAVKQAQDNFKVVLEQAITDLKASLGPIDIPEPI